MSPQCFGRDSDKIAIIKFGRAAEPMAKCLRDHRRPRDIGRDRTSDLCDFTRRLRGCWPGLFEFLGQLPQRFRRGFGLSFRLCVGEIFLGLL